jgi:hypothetical protein
MTTQTKYVMRQLLALEVTSIRRLISANRTEFRPVHQGGRTILQEGSVSCRQRVPAVLLTAQLSTNVCKTPPAIVQGAIPIIAQRENANSTHPALREAFIRRQTIGARVRQATGIHVHQAGQVSVTRQPA